MQSETQLRLCTAKPWADSSLLLETFLRRKSWESLTVQWPLWNSTAQKTAASKTGGSIVWACQRPCQCFRLFRSCTGLFGKVKVVVKLIFLLKGFPIPCRKVKHTHSSTAWLKLFLIVHLWRGKQTGMDVVSASLFPSERALKFKVHVALCAPYYFGFSINSQFCSGQRGVYNWWARDHFWDYCSFGGGDTYAIVHGMRGGCFAVQQPAKGRWESSGLAQTWARCKELAAGSLLMVWAALYICGRLQWMTVSFSFKGMLAFKGTARECVKHYVSLVQNAGNSLWRWVSAFHPSCAEWPSETQV